MSMSMRFAGTLGERAQSFWEHLISRHPIEWSYAKPNKLLYRWREIPDLRLVVVQYIGKRHIGVFVRGERGVAHSAVRDRLKPFGKELQKAVRAKPFFDSKFFFNKQEEGTKRRCGEMGCYGGLAS